jgi:hypothetical protein
VSDLLIGPLPLAQPPQEFFKRLMNPGPQSTDAVSSGFAVLPKIPPPSSALLLVESSPYHEYWVSKQFFDVSGLKGSPVQGPVGTPLSVTREVAPYGWLVVHWEAKRLGASPIIPSRDMQDPNLFYLGGMSVGDIPGTIADGSKWNMIAGCYLYGMRIPYKETDVMVLSARPDSEDIVANNTISPANYALNIIGPNLPPAGAPTSPITF